MMSLPVARKSRPSKTTDEGEVLDGDLTGDMAGEMRDHDKDELARLRAKEEKKRAQGVKDSAK